MRRDLRRKYLADLGWTIIGDNAIIEPGEDPDEALVVWNLATAARRAGLPVDLDELSQWGRHRAREQFSTPPVAAQRQASVDTSPAGDERKPSAATDESVTYVPVEEHITGRASFLQDAKEREALRIESALVQQFTGYLEQMGHQTSGVKVRIDEEEVIRADLFDITTRVLYEAKASPDRQKIRMAIGQLLDYKRLLEPQPQLRVLVPGPPKPDLCRLLAGVGIGATWPEHDGWCDMEPDALGSRSSR